MCCHVLWFHMLILILCCLCISDIEQARYLVKELHSSNPHISKYLEEQVIPIYEKVLKNIPPLSQLERTKGLYAFTKEDYELGIGKVYTKCYILQLLMN